MITSIEDYEKGVYELPFSSITAKQLECYIDEFEPQYLNDLLGCELANLFIDDLDNGLPQSERFLNIYNEFCVSDYCSYLKSLGMKIMIKGFIYWEYGITLTADLSMLGANNSTGENQVVTKQSATRLLPNYNRSIDTYDAIQRFICNNKEVYPEFKGTEKGYAGII